MAQFSMYKIYMPGLVVRPHAKTLISVLLGGIVSHNESSEIGLCDSSATGDCLAAGTGISLYCHYNWG